MTTSIKTSTKFAFTYNHITKKIVGTDINFQKAGIPGSDLEAELLARMAAQPSYTFEVIATEKKPAKQTYAGLTQKLMKEYIAIQEEAKKAELNAQLDKMINDKIAYPTIKSWFLDEFKGFNVNKAKTLIKEKKLNATKAKVRLVKATVKTDAQANVQEAIETAVQDENQPDIQMVA